jgi:MFS family permease
VLQQKIPCLRNVSLVNLSIAEILLGSIGQLIFPALGLLLEKQGLIFHFGPIFLTLMVSQVLFNLFIRRSMKRWGAKKVVQAGLIIYLVPCVLLVIAMQDANILCYYLAMAIGPGIGNSCSVIVLLMLRKQLGENDHIKGISQISFATVLAVTACTWLGFQGSPYIWAIVVAVLQLGIVVMLFFCVSDAEEPKEQSLKGLLYDPATRINAGNFCMLFVFFCFGKLLPLAEVVDEEQVDILLLVISLLSGLTQVPLSSYAGKHKSKSNWIILVCRMCMWIGLAMMAVSGGSWTAIGIGGFLWALGVCSNSLVNHVSYANAKDRVLGGTLPDVTWNLSGLIGGAYIWFAESVHVSHQIALQWLLVPAGISIVLAMIMWKLHKLPNEGSQIKSEEAGTTDAANK